SLVDTLDDVSQSTLSQHLSIMQSRGILVRRKEGTQVFYDVSDQKIFQFLALVEELFCKGEK
ncbi:MAG: helix-turn-helix transcriptional regulator, partial [Deltaproteobacteria bacterium]|nr:helix-turn-helix transcriptional regulator [Deltaproteobacteria bacterium]